MPYLRNSNSVLIYQPAITVEISILRYLFVSVALICFVLNLTKIILLNICILHCLVLLNSILFKSCLFRYLS